MNKNTILFGYIQDFSVYLLDNIYNNNVYMESINKLNNVNATATPPVKKDTKKKLTNSDFSNALEEMADIWVTNFNKATEQAGQNVKLRFVREYDAKLKILQYRLTVTENGIATDILVHNIKEEDVAKAASGMYRKKAIIHMFYDIMTSGVIYINAEVHRMQQVKKEYDLDLKAMEAGQLITYITSVHPDIAQVEKPLELILTKEGKWDIDKLTSAIKPDLIGWASMIKKLMLS